ncbi:MAG: extracellular solute-binding protein [Hyphomonadaceae bacterium]|nr:extracellular solute-binding protein [Hyphomonadaceae bacterium]
MVGGWLPAPVRTVFARVLLLLAAFAGLSLAAACQPADDSNTLVIWHGYRGEEKVALEEVIALWNSRAGDGQPRVKAVAVPGEALPNKLSASVPRGKGPDLFLFAHDRMGGWAEGGDTLEPLDFWVTDEDRARYLPGMLDSVTYKGVIYALPLNYKSIALIYNKDLVPVPPRTTAELVAMAKANTDAARGKFGLVYTYDDYFFHAALQNGFGGGVFDDALDIQLDAPANVKAGDLLLSWKDEARILPLDPTPSLMDSLFNAGRAAFIFNGPWFIGQIKPGLNYGVAPLPALSEAGGAPMRPWMSVEAVYLAANKPDPVKAFRFAQFLTGEEAAAIMARKGGQLPSSRGAYDLPDVAANPVIQAFRAQQATAVATPNSPEMTLVWTPAETALRRIIKGETTPAAAMADLQREVGVALEALKASAGGGS